MGDEDKGPAVELPYRLKGRRKFAGEPLGGSYFIGYSRGTLEEALNAAVNGAKKKSGTTFVVTQIEVVSEGDPHVGGYKVILTAAG